MFKRFKWGLLLLSLLNVAGLGFLGVKWMQRFYRQDWVVIQARTLIMLKSEHNLLLGDSHFDNLCALPYLRGKVSCIAVPGIEIQGLNGIVQKLPVSSRTQNCFILVGINNLRNGQTPLQVQEQYQTLLQTCKQKMPNGRFFVLSLLPIVEHLEINRTLQNQQIAAQNQLLKKLCDESNLHFLNVYDLFAQHGHLPMAYTYDGLHLSPQANQLLFQCIDGFLDVQK